MEQTIKINDAVVITAGFWEDTKGIVTGVFSGTFVIRDTKGNEFMVFSEFVEKVSIPANKPLPLDRFFIVRVYSDTDTYQYTEASFRTLETAIKFLWESILNHSMFDTGTITDSSTGRIVRQFI